MCIKLAVRETGLKREIKSPCNQNTLSKITHHKTDYCEWLLFLTKIHEPVAMVHYINLLRPWT